MDTPGKVTRELDEFVGDVDAIFVECPDEKLSLRELLRALFLAPVYLLGALTLQQLFYIPLYLLFNRDLVPTELVAIERVTGEETPVHRIDDPILVRLGQVGPGVTLANWVVLAVVVWFGPRGVVATGALVLSALVPVLLRRWSRYVAITAAFCWYVGLIAVAGAGYLSVPLLLVGVIAFTVALSRSIDGRNEVMLDRITDRSAEGDYENAILVTGKGHLAGLVRLADERDLSVPHVHISEWRDAGVTFTEFEPSELPEIGRLDGSSGEFPGVVSGSERAAAGRRAAAAFADGVPAILLTVVGMVPTTIGYGYVTGPETNPSFAVTVLTSGVVSLVGYYAVLEWRFSTTPGKHVVGLTVGDAEGGRVSGRQALVRNLLRPVDALAFYALGGVAMASNERRRRLGDFAAGTIVGRVAVGASPTEADSPTDAAWRRTPEMVPGSERTGLFKRARAGFVDALLAFLVATVGIIVVGMAAEIVPGVTPGMRIFWLYVPLWPVCLVAYHAVLEWRYGTTPSKYMFGLVVADAEGGRLSGRQVLLRNLLRPLDVLVCYALGAVAMRATDRRQRLGDVVAGTVVGRRGPSERDAATAEIPLDTEPRRHPRFRPGSERRVFRKRVGAAAVDGVAVLLLAFAAAVAVGVAYEVLPGYSAQNLDLRHLELSLVASLVGYHAALEWLYGQTAGKRLFGLVVADADGGQVSPRAVLLRNVLRPLDAATLYSLGAFVAFFSKHSQHLGDHIAGTVVGRCKPQTDGRATQSSDARAQGR